MSEDPGDSKNTNSIKPKKKDSPQSDRRSSSLDSHHRVQRPGYTTTTAAFRRSTGTESKQQPTAKAVVQRRQSSSSTEYLSTTYNNDPMRGIESGNTAAGTTFDQINQHDRLRIPTIVGTRTTIGETSESKKSSGPSSDVVVT